MNLTVPNSTIICMVITMIAGFALPAVLCLIMKKKTSAKLSAFFVGCGVMLVFAFILEQIVHTIVLTSGVGTAITGSIWLYGLYGGLMAGLFEETGRFVAFKTMLKKDLEDNGTALMYGAGHGGFETFYILVIGMVNNLLYAIMMNNGMAQALTAGLTGDALASVEAVFTALATTASPVFLVGIAERMFAMTAHVAFSVLVFFAVKKGGKTFWLYPLAILLHAVLDFVVAIVNAYSGNIWVVEGMVLVCAVVFVVVARMIWKKNV